MHLCNFHKIKNKMMRTGIIASGPEKLTDV